MNQDIITLGIVFSAVAYAAWSLYATLTEGGHSKCEGCKGCTLKKELAGHLIVPVQQTEAGK